MTNPTGPEQPIEERLREATNTPGKFWNSKLVSEAADEIARLREENERLRVGTQTSIALLKGHREMEAGLRARLAAAEKVVEAYREADLSEWDQKQRAAALAEYDRLARTR